MRCTSDKYCLVYRVVPCTLQLTSDAKNRIVIATSRCTIEGQRCEEEEKMKERVEKRRWCRHLAAGEAGRVSARVGGGWGNGDATRILTCSYIFVLQLLISASPSVNKLINVLHLIIVICECIESC